MTKRHLMMTVAAVSLLAMTTPAKAYDDMAETSMMDSFVQSIQDGLNEIQSWFTPAEGDVAGTEMAAGEGDMIEIPPQLIEPAAGDEMMDAATDAVMDAMEAVDEATQPAQDAAMDAVEAVDEATQPAQDTAADAVEAVEEMVTETTEETTEAGTEAAEEVEAVADEAMDAMDESAGEAEETTEEVIDEATDAMDEQSMAPTQPSPTMERIEAQALNPVQEEVEQAAETTTTPDMDAPVGAPVDAMTNRTAPIEKAAQDMAEQVDVEVNEALDVMTDRTADPVDGAAEAAADELSQTGNAFQVEGSVSAFEDPMTPEQLNAIQAAAGEAEEVVEGMATDFANDNLPE